MPADSHDPTRIFEAERGRLQSIAYGMTGQVMDAEDVVQDAWLRWQGADHGTITNPAGWLTTVVTRLAIDRLRSARHRRETYVGPWLPEPQVTHTELLPAAAGPAGPGDGRRGRDPAELVAEAEQLSMAFLVALERLNPVERAVLLLREVFDLDYAEISPVVDRNPANCRQIARRARDRVGDAGRVERPSPEQRRELAVAFFSALAGGDLDALMATLAADITLRSDGGGKARAAAHPIHGADRVARFLIGVGRNRQPGDRAALVEVNGEPALYLQRGGRPFAVLVIESRDGLVTAIHGVLNPDKLTHLADLDAPIPVDPA